MRRKKTGDNVRFSPQRVLKLLGVGLVAGYIFYLYQPMRADILPPRAPSKRESRPIETTGLLRPKARILIVTAHPDDEAFYLGGTLLRIESSAIVHLVVLTDGDKGYYPFIDSKAISRTRQGEVRTLAQKVGIDSTEFHQEPDGRLRPEPKTVRRLEQVLREFKPDDVLVFDDQYWPKISHNDHRNAGIVSVLALEGAKFTGGVFRYSTTAPNTTLDVSSVWPEAQQNLGIHASQFFGSKLELIQLLTTSYAIESGTSAGFTFGEAFRYEVWRDGKVISR
jgi:LmbE family N-acetylglucosaminyl deacetylase